MIDTFFVERQVLLIDREGGGGDRFTGFALNGEPVKILFAVDDFAKDHFELHLLAL